MARLDDFDGKKITLDTVVFIYALEGNDQFGKRVKQIFTAIENL